MKKLIATLALVIPLLALGACGSALPTTIPTESTTPEPTVTVTSWRADCGQDMFSQLAATSGTFATDAVNYVGSQDPSAFRSDASQDQYLLGQWQTCASKVTFDLPLRIDLLGVITATTGLWDQYLASTPMSAEAIQYGQSQLQYSHDTTTELCTLHDPAMQSC